MDDINTKILNAYQSNDFFAELYAIYRQNKDNFNAFHQAVISQHNDKKIDFLEEILKIDHNNDNFFKAKILFEEILPDLDITIQKSMDCVRHVFQESKNIMSAGEVFLSFSEYCKKDENRISEALKIIDVDIGWAMFIPSIIKAGSQFNLDKYIKVAINFTQHSNEKICEKGVYSLGILQYENHPDSLKKSFQAIKTIIEKEYSNMFAISIETIFNLSIFDDKLEDETAQLIEIALKNADDIVLHSASILCFYQREKLPLKLFNILLHALEEVNYKNAGTIANIDHGLQYLLGKDQNMVVSYLEKILIKNQELSIKSFGFLLRDLHQKDNHLLNHIITKWFISGDIHLCKNVMDIINLDSNKKIILSADISQLKTKSSMMHQFVIKKAIGWLFFNQISAISFLISMIDILDKDNIQTVEDLLFNPFLISYPSSVKDYLHSIQNRNDKIKKLISRLLERLEKYHNDIDHAWDIKELKPSQEQRESYFRFHNQQMSQTMQDAKKNSVFLDLVSEFVILYGRKSVIYHPELGDNSTNSRQEMNLQKHEFSVEYPKLDFLDPHGLDGILNFFRYEQFKE